MSSGKLNAKSLAITVALFALYYVILLFVAVNVSNLSGGLSKIALFLIVLVICVLASGAYFSKKNSRLFSRLEKIIFIIGAVLISMATIHISIVVSGTSIDPSVLLTGALVTALINLVVIWLVIGALAPRLYKKWIVQT